MGRPPHHHRLGKNGKGESPVQRLHQIGTDVLAELLTPRPSECKSKSRRKFDPSGVDWESIAKDADQHAVGVLVYQRLKDLDLAKYLPDQVHQRWKLDSLHAKLQHLIQRDDALKISNRFTEAGIRHAFIKGFAYRDWLYVPAWVRLGGDADILIDRSSIEDARKLLREDGFVQAAYSADHKHFRAATPDEIAQVESQHHELAEFTKDHILVHGPKWLLDPNFSPRSPFAFGTVSGKPVLHSSIDIHWAIHFLFANSRSLDSIVNGADQAIGVRARVPVVSVEWNIVISSFKLYFESFDRPRYGFNHLVDLIALLDLAPNIRWEYLDALVSQYRLESAIFYTLSAAQAISGRHQVPHHLLDRWSTISAPAGFTAPHPLDYGDFVTHLLEQRIATHFMPLRQTGGPS